MIMLMILSALAGAALYRWRGGMPPDMPKVVKVSVWAIPLAVAAAMSTPWDVLFPWEVGLAVLLATYFATKTGHGSYMDLGTMPKPDNELLRYVLDLFMENTSNFTRDFIGLSLTGLLVTLPVGIAMANPLVAASGLLKAPAYWLGQSLPSLPQLRGFTEWGEALFGAVVYASVFAGVVSYAGH